jgi:hypothetical protein
VRAGVRSEAGAVRAGAGPRGQAGVRMGDTREGDAFAFKGWRATKASAALAHFMTGVVIFQSLCLMHSLPKRLSSVIVY